MALPLPKRKPEPQKGFTRAKTQAKAWVIVKTAKYGTKAAKKGGKKVAKSKAKKTARRPPVVLLVAVPVVAGGGFVVWRKTRSNGADEAQERPLGPVASADSVSPPAARSDGDGSPAEDSSLTDPPAGAANPPIGEQSQTS
jgi:hypothetical protein